MVFQSIPRERIISAIEKLGPAQPLDVRRELGEGDTVLIGAILSEMTHAGLIAISKTKRGGSPFYYLPQKPESLETISQYLNEKDRRTYDLLEEKNVLREETLEPLTRVGLQNIPDFSRRFTLESNGQEIAYWRYYLIPEEEARSIISPPKPSSSIAPQKHSEVNKEQSTEKEAVKQETQTSLNQEKKQSAPVRQKSKSRPKKEINENWIGEDTLYPLVTAFAQEQQGELFEPVCIKPSGEICALMEVDGTYGSLTYYVYAVSRKTLPAHMVFKQLLEARSKGLPLLVLKDSEYPKSIFKKFDDVPNVFFKRV